MMLLLYHSLLGEPMTIYGDGSQTRSFQYVSDLVTGLVRLMEENYTQPVNIGNPIETSIKEFAERIRYEVAKSTIKLSDGNGEDNKKPVKGTAAHSEIIHLPAVEDDPRQRRPDITLAKKVLGWAPEIGLDEGLFKTIQYFRRELERKTFDVLDAMSENNNIDDVTLGLQKTK